MALFPETSIPPILLTEALWLEPGKYVWPKEEDDEVDDERLLSVSLDVADVFSVSVLSPPAMCSSRRRRDCWRLGKTGEAETEREASRDEGESDEEYAE